MLLRSALVSRKHFHDTIKAQQRAPSHRPTAVVEASNALQDVLEQAEQAGLAQPSAAEQQVEPKAFRASHGIRLWAGMMK